MLVHLFLLNMRAAIIFPGNNLYTLNVTTRQDTDIKKIEGFIHFWVGTSLLLHKKSSTVCLELLSLHFQYKVGFH